MRSRIFYVFLLFPICIPAQTLSNTSLSGKYFVRHVQFTTNASNGVTDARSIVGSLIFAPGPGTYTLTGQQVIGSGSSASFTATGSYSVSSAGFVTLTNPQTASATINARFGTEAVVGSSTEISGNTFDMFVAVPAPSVAPTNASLMGYWNATDFELTAASTAQVRDSFVQFSLDGAGNMPTTTVKGHAANYANSATVNQVLPVGAYAVNPDGTGTVTFPAPTGTVGAGVLVSSAQRTLMISQSGHVMVVSTPGAHDILIALQAPITTTAPISLSRDWLTGIRADTSGYSDSFIASTTAIVSDAAIVSSRRLHEALSPTPINVTESLSYTVASDGTGSVGPAQIAASAAGIVSADVGGVFDPTGYEIGFATTIPTVSGAGVFINPQGIVNAAGNSPVGNPISPGEFIAIYGSSLANQTTVAAIPYPATLSNVTVNIGGLPAPIYLVAAGQINCVVPFGVDTTKQTVNIVVTNNGVMSNTVTVPLSTTSPGIFSDDTSGTGDGAIIHLNGTLVTSANPATRGEILSIYLAGLGAVTTPVQDGTLPNPQVPDNVTAQVLVYVYGIPVTPLFAGLNPYFPGLYQINFTVPASLTVSGELPVAIQTPDSFHDQINLAVQ